MFRFLMSWGTRTQGQALPCVGLIVVLGCFSFLIAPDDNFAPASHRTVPGNGPDTVIIDPGHGGIDDGTAYYGLAEKVMTLDVAKRLEGILKGMHIATVLTRHEDVYVSLPERAEIANRVADTNKNVIYLSIHFNQSGAEEVDGIETYYADRKIPQATDWTWIGFFDDAEESQLDLGANLASYMQNSLTARMMLPNRGIKSRSLFVVRHTRMPAVLVECAFLSNRAENQALRASDYRDRIAQGLAAGIVSYFQSRHPAPPPHLASTAAPFGA